MFYGNAMTVMELLITASTMTWHSIQLLAELRTANDDLASHDRRRCAPPLSGCCGAIPLDPLLRIAM